MRLLSSNASPSPLLRQRRRCPPAGHRASPSQRVPGLSAGIKPLSAPGVPEKGVGLRCETMPCARGGREARHSLFVSFPYTLFSMEPQSDAMLSRFRTELEYVRTLPPSLRSEPKRSFSRVLHSTGITVLPEGRPRGVIKYLPTDFVVEEIDSNDERISLTEIPEFEDDVWGEYIKVRFLKVGIYSTLHASLELAKAFNIPVASVQYAGVKDECATTAQDMTLHGVTKEQVLNYRDPRFQLFPLHATSEPLKRGNLVGNHFTILVRTEAPVDQVWVDQMCEWIKTHGILNFYGPQRFNEPRCLAHVFGRLIFQGKTDQAVKSFLLERSAFELRYVAHLRTQAASCYGNWERMHAIFSVAPQSCEAELRLLESLIAGTSITDALNAISDQVHYWALAYTSLLANEYISNCVHKKLPLPDELPLLLSTTKWAWDIYKKQLHRDLAQKYIEHVSKIPAIRMSKNPRMPTSVHPKIYVAKVLPEGVVFEFDLPKGAYATTLLSYFFDLLTPPPRPAHIATHVVDVKAAAGTGSLASIIDRSGAQITEMREFYDLLIEKA